MKNIVSSGHPVGIAPYWYGNVSRLDNAISAGMSESHLTGIEISICKGFLPPADGLNRTLLVLKSDMAERFRECREQSESHLTGIEIGKEAEETLLWEQVGIAPYWYGNDLIEPASMQDALVGIAPYWYGNDRASTQMRTASAGLNRTLLVLK